MVFKADRTNQSHSLLKLFWLIVCPFWIAFWILLQTDVQKNSVQFFEPEFFTAKPIELPISSKYFLVNTEGCRIPMMDPFDPSIRQYIVTGEGWNSTNDDDNERPISCSPPQQKPNLSPIVTSNLTHIFLDDNSIAERNLTATPDCCYEPFWRQSFNISVEDAQNIREADKLFEAGGTCIDFEGPSAHMGENEFVKVECYLAGTNKTEKIYKDFFSFTPITKKESRITKTQGDRWNVLIFGVDAVSRMNLYRQMPKTLDYIKNQLKAVELFGYNKVADNTFPNLVPVLAGLSVDELKNSCWPTQNTYFDKCPFLWKEFKKAGYRTLFAEDASWMGIFSYMKRGFFKEPTDYYWKTFNGRAESEIGSEKRLNAHLCTGYRTTLQTLLDYGKKFTITMATKVKESFFGLIWGASMSHDYLNLPRYGDEDHATFLRDLNEKGAFENCILVFMSDHGIRWGSIRSTYQGHLEERLPFLFFVFPKLFKVKYPMALGHLHSNSHRLTTPYDLHETLLDILYSDQNLRKDALKQRMKLDPLLNSSSVNASTLNRRIKRGISMFLPIPKTRTCEEAGISNHWCTCHRATAISVSDENVIKASEHLIDHINGLLNGEAKQCAVLTPKRIISARVEETLPETENESGKKRKKRSMWLRDYIITVEASPGGGNFEATVRRTSNGTFKMMGAVSRTNVYGNQSACITNYRLKLYCYCFDYKQK